MVVQCRLKIWLYKLDCTSFDWLSEDEKINWFSVNTKYRQWMNCKIREKSWNQSRIFHRIEKGRNRQLRELGLLVPKCKVSQEISETLAKELKVNDAVFLTSQLKLMNSSAWVFNCDSTIFIQIECSTSNVQSPFVVQLTKIRNLADAWL